MKKIAMILLCVIIMMSCLVACGVEIDESDVIGTWEYVTDDIAADCVFKNGGTGSYMCLNSKTKVFESYTFTWKISESSIKVTYDKNERENEKFTMSSDKQSIKSGGWKYKKIVSKK